MLSAQLKRLVLAAVILGCVFGYIHLVSGESATEASATGYWHADRVIEHKKHVRIRDARQAEYRADRKARENGKERVYSSDYDGFKYRKAASRQMFQGDKFVVAGEKFVEKVDALRGTTWKGSGSAEGDTLTDNDNIWFEVTNMGHSDVELTRNGVIDRLKYDYDHPVVRICRVDIKPNTSFALWAALFGYDPLDKDIAKGIIEGDTMTFEVDGVEIVFTREYQEMEREEARQIVYISEEEAEQKKAKAETVLDIDIEDTAWEGSGSGEVEGSIITDNLIFRDRYEANGMSISQDNAKLTMDGVAVIYSVYYDLPFFELSVISVDGGEGEETLQGKFDSNNKLTLDGDVYRIKYQGKSTRIFESTVWKHGWTWEYGWERATNVLRLGSSLHSPMELTRDGVTVNYSCYFDGDFFELRIEGGETLRVEYDSFHNGFIIDGDVYTKQ